MTSDKLDLSETNAMISEDEALNKMRDTVEQQFAELGDKVAALATRYESDSKARKEAGGRITLDLSQKVEAPSRRPPCAEDGLVIFCEFEGVACSIDTEAALVGEAGSAGSTEERLKRLQAALAGETLEHALSRLEAAGAALAPGFAAFAEACLVKGVTLHVLSRGWKPVVSHFLRSAGLGHVQVSANNLLEQEGKWRFSFRDHSAAGHDKAEALRRAQRDARPAQPEALLVGRFACDLAAAQAKDELVRSVYAARDSELWSGCEAAGVPVREFGGWAAFAEEVLH